VRGGLAHTAHTQGSHDAVVSEFLARQRSVGPDCHVRIRKSGMIKKTAGVVVFNLTRFARQYVAVAAGPHILCVGL